MAKGKQKESLTTGHLWLVKFEMKNSFFGFPSVVEFFSFKYFTSQNFQKYRNKIILDKIGREMIRQNVQDLSPS